MRILINYKKRPIFHRHAYFITLVFSALWTRCLHSANIVASKVLLHECNCCVKSVITRVQLLNGFFTLMCRVLCDNINFLI